MFVCLHTQCNTLQHTHVCIFIRLHIYMCMYTYIHKYTFGYLYVCMHWMPFDMSRHDMLLRNAYCIHVHIYIHIFHICVHTYAYTAQTGERVVYTSFSCSFCIYIIRVCIHMYTQRKVVSGSGGSRFYFEIFGNFLILMYTQRKIVSGSGDSNINPYSGWGESDVDEAAQVTATNMCSCNKYV